MQQGRPDAGWYQDPNQPLQLRYWDGKEWTEHVHSNQPEPLPEVEKSYTFTYLGIALGAVAVALTLAASIVSPELVLLRGPKSAPAGYEATLKMLLAMFGFLSALAGIWVSWLGYREFRNVEPRPRRTLVALLLNVVALVAGFGVPLS